MLVDLALIIYATKANIIFVPDWDMPFTDGIKHKYTPIIAIFIQ